MSSVKWEQKTGLDTGNPRIDVSVTLRKRGKIVGNQEKSFTLNQESDPIEIVVRGNGHVNMASIQEGPGQPFELKLKKGQRLKVLDNSGNVVKLKRTRR